LKFNEKWNACLYDGQYKTKPDSGHSIGQIGEIGEIGDGWIWV